MWQPRGAWIVDIRHWIEGDPAEALPLGLIRRRAFHGHIISAATVFPRDPFLTAIGCPLRPKRKPCGGVIAVEVEDDSDHPFIYWTCTACGYHGRIAGFRGSWYDLGRYRKADSMTDAIVPVTVALEEYQALLSGSMVAYGPAALRVIYSAQSDGTRAVLAGTTSGLSFLAAAVAADLALEKKAARRSLLSILHRKLTF